MADGTQRASIDGGVGGDVTSFAACGVPPAGALGMFSANDSELLCSASAADVEDAIRAAQEELALEGRRHHQDARSEAKRAELADRVLRKDGHKLLSRVHTKLQEHGIEVPTVQLEFRGVRVTTEALVGNAGISTVGSIPMGVLKRLVGRGGQALREICVLGGPGGPLSGVIKPGRTTLLLGAPGCGKSTLMRVLAHRLRGCGSLKVEGEVLYNGHSKHDIAVERAVAFVEQRDNHVGNLTVSETLSFAHVCQSGQDTPSFDMQQHIREAKLNKSRADLHQLRAASPTPAGGPGAVNADQLKATVRAQLEEDEVEALLTNLCGTSGIKVELIMRWMGLAHVRNSLVGDVLVRGLSGGERKRLTCAEGLMGQQRVLMLDEINTGLDSATLHSVVTFLALMSRGLKMTTLISLLQPAPEVVELFDDIMLMAEGAILYHGPVAEVLPHFAALGFDRPPRKDLASFLQEVSTPAGQLAYASQALRERRGLLPSERGRTAAPSAPGRLTRSSVPQDLIVSVAEMAEQFRTGNEHGQAAQRELAAGPFPKERSHPAALPKERYALSPWRALCHVTRRQLLLVGRDKMVLQGRIMQVIVIGLVVGSLFFQLGNSTLQQARSTLGACFLCVMFLSFGGMVQVAVVMASRPVWFKHRDSNYYPSWTQGLAMAFSQLPVTLLEAAVFSVIVYFMIGFITDAARFFTFLAVMASTSLCLTSLFRLIAVAVPTPPLVNAVSGILLLLLIVTSGFTIVRNKIPPYAIWLYWLSPFAWGVRSTCINEFMTDKWAAPAPSNPAHTIGEEALLSFGFYTEHFWVWTGVGYLLGLFAVLSVLVSLALGWISDPEQMQKARADAAAMRGKMAKMKGTTPRPGSSIHAGGALSKPRSAASVAPARGDEPGVEAVIQLAALQPVQPLGVDGGASAPAGELALSLPRAPSRAALAGGDLSSVPVEPITLAFKDIRYFVPNPAYKPKAAAAASQGPPKDCAADVEAQTAGAAGDGAAAGAVGPAEQAEADAVAALAATPQLELLKGITGYAQPGDLMALMGGSGAGKTTLMDVLCGRKTVGEVRGDIWVNGHPKEQASWSRVVGYCEQNDIHTAAQTVIEALWFSARLRLPPSVSDSWVRSWVVEVLDLVDLMPQAHSLVGDPAGPGGGTGLSLEQRKRLTIAVELVANPSVVFMDEPTSGLDASSAATVMRAVRNIGTSGRTIIVTIHQPSIEIFEAFDSLLLLQRGGRTTYFGPLGEHSRTLADYLMRVPGTEPLNPSANPATWMLEVTGGSMATITKANAVDWPAHWAESSEAAAALAEVERLVAEGAAASLPLVMPSEYAQPFSVQMRELLSKYTMMYWRSPSYNFARVALTFIVGWLYGAIYFQVGAVQSAGGVASIATVQNVMGVLFSSSNFIGMTNLMSVLPVMGAERVVYYREAGARPYSVWGYGFALAIVELPYILLQAVLFAPVVYFMVGFQATFEKFVHYLLMFTVSLYYYTVFGQFLVWATPSQQLGQVLGGTLNFIMNIANGFVVTYPSLPVYWQWVNRLVPNTWVLYGIAASQMSDLDTPIAFGGRTYAMSDFLERVWGYTYDMRWWCVLIVFANMLFYRVASILALRYFRFLKR